MKAQNEHLKLMIVELQGIIKAQGTKVEELQVQNADLEKIREVLIFPSNVTNYSLLFGEDIKKEGQMSGQKILTILLKYSCKMEAIL